ncbi:MAG: hypothetical protein IJE92_05590 [Clostridia bacterium]|nr:hypothetical protein [Clostridia bacterium]
MVTIGIVDDGVGIFPALYKLKQVVPSNVVALVTSDNFHTLDKRKLCSLAERYVDVLKNRGCDCVVFSSVDLSMASYKHLTAQTDYPIFGCEAPINHATTYTISNVLVCGGPKVKYVRQQNVIACPLPEFPALAEAGNIKNIVEYIRQTTAPFDGQFDCIALAHSAMNLYKNCFARVFPNVQIFDSLDGVARRIRKRYKKYAKEDGDITLMDPSGNDLSAKYAHFLQ